MVKAVLNDEIIRELSGLKGSILENIEGAFDNDEVFGNVRINTSQGCIDLECTPKTERYFDGIEDLCYFACSLINKKQKFVPYARKKAKKKIIGEKIEGIKLVRTTIELPKNNYAIEIDQILEIETSKNTIMFLSQGCFTEGIQVKINGLLDDIYPISKVVEFWSEDNEKAIVKRIIIDV